MHRLTPTLIAEMGEAYPELKRAQPVIKRSSMRKKSASVARSPNGLQSA